MLLFFVFAASQALVPDARPMPQQRTFSSPVIESVLQELGARQWQDQDLRTVFLNCFPNTLDATVKHFSAQGREDTYLLVGNINVSIVGMWLRDSSNQVAPYIQFASKEPEHLGALLRGLLNRHVDSVLLDPYAMAFSLVAPNGESNRHTDDNTTCLNSDGERVNAMDKKMGVRERKWEMDSVLGTLRLGRRYHEHTKDARPFDAQWRRAVATIIETLRAMQKPLTARNITQAPYTFQRKTNEPKDTLAHGVGRPVLYTGMVRTGFRPSDDATVYPYHIPANAMAVVELRATAALLRTFGADGDTELAEAADILAMEIDRGVQRHGIVRHPNGDDVYAMEVDGFGNAFFADDANVPSLLSLPYLGYLNASDPTYTATRRYILSAQTNPYFYGPGTEGVSGVGSDNVGDSVGWGHVWPMGLMVRAITSEDDAEVSKLLRDLVRSSSNGFMHESVWIDNLTSFTNPSFAWANSLMGELLLHLNATRPHLLFANSGKLHRIGEAQSQ